MAPPEVVLSETGAGWVTLTSVPGGAMVSMGRNRPWLRGKVVGHGLHDAFETGAESGVVGQVDADARLGVGAGEVEDHAAALLSQGQPHGPRALPGLDGGAVAPLAVGDILQALAQRPFGIVDHLRGHGVHEVDAVEGIELLHARLGHAVAGKLAVDVEGYHVGTPGHVDQGVEHVLAQVAAVHQLDARNAQTLVTDLLGLGGIAARRHGADVHHMDERRAPTDQAAFHVDGRDEVDVRLMDGRHVGIVQEEDIVLVHPIIFGKTLLDPFDCESGAGHVPGHGLTGGQDLAVGAVERGHVVVHLGRVDRSAHPLDGRAHLLGDALEPVREDLEGHRIHGPAVTALLHRSPPWKGSRASRP